MDAATITRIPGQSAFTREFGAIIADDGSRSLRALDIDQVMRVFRSSGFILFRGFAVEEDGLRAFTDRFTARFIGHGNLDRTLISEDSTLMTVTPGQDVIHAHSEMSYTPLRPDVIWFHCVQPASEHGETFVVDGVRVYDEMRAPTRALLSSRKIVHRFRDIAPEAWQRMLRTDDAGAALRMLDALPGFSYQITAAGRLDAEYVTSAIKPTKYGRALAFNSSILDVGGVFQDGSEIPAEIFRELKEQTGDLARLIAWKANDIAMIDNTRILHGRRPFTDPRRRLHIRMANLEM